MLEEKRKSPSRVGTPFGMIPDRSPSKQRAVYTPANPLPSDALTVVTSRFTYRLGVARPSSPLGRGLSSDIPNLGIRPAARSLSPCTQPIATIR